MNVLFDTNIILDVFQNRAPFLKDAQTLLTMAKNKEINGYLSAKSIPDLWYVMRKQYSSDERRIIISSLMEIFQITDLKKEMIQNALTRSNFPDFEDCLIDECAMEGKADCIITRNPKDFTEAITKIYTPQEFIKTYA